MMNKIIENNKAHFRVPEWEKNNVNLNILSLSSFKSKYSYFETYFSFSFTLFIDIT